MPKDSIWSSRRYPCPICQHTHGCRLFHDGKVWCLRHFDESECPPGYRFIGALNNSMGGSFVPDWRSSSYQPPLIVGKRHSQQKSASAGIAPAKSLSLAERHRAIHLLHAHLGLTPRHWQYLVERRGLYLFDIARGMYFSLYPCQRLPDGIPDRFPGTTRASSGRMHFNNYYSGIACPIFNHEGLAVGLQMRVLDKRADPKSRYRWLSDGEGNRSHLPNGELPIAYWQPPEIHRGLPVGLVEGTGFKPAIASRRLNQILIGAAGGQHTGSPTQLRTYLEVAARHGAEAGWVQIYLDGGDVENAHVMYRLSQLVDFLQRWGYRVEIAWWGQNSKSDPDIDELTKLSAISYISCEGFMPLKVFDQAKGRNDGICLGKPASSQQTLETLIIVA